MENSIYQSVIDNAPFGYACLKVIRDEQGKPEDYEYIEVNPVYKSITGIEKVKGEKVSTLFSGIKWKNSLCLNHFEEIAINGGIKDHEHYFEHLERWYKVQVYAVGKSHIATVFYDVSAQKQAEKKLAYSEQNYRELVENMNEVVYKLDINAIITYISPNVELISGYSPDYLIGRSFTELVYPEDLSGRIKNFQRVLAGYSAPSEYRFITKSGKVVWIQTNAKPIYKKDKLVGIQGILINIDKRKQMEHALEDSRNNYKNETYRLSALLSNIPGGILIETPQREIYKVNRQFCDLFGINLSPESLEGENCRELAEQAKAFFTKEEDFITRTNENIAKGKTVLNEVFYLKDGRVFERDFVPVQMENRKTEMLWHYRDITKRIENEQELINAKEKAQEGERLKSLFLANMSHEIRTPMNAIVGFADLILEEYLDTNEVKEYAGFIASSGSHLLNLINDIIDISKIDAGHTSLELESTEVNSMLIELNNILSNELENKGKSHLQLICKAPEQNICAITDKTRLRQVLINLLQNAAKYTEEGSIEFGCKPEHSSLLFYVKDTGIGIGEKQKELVFKRFYQAYDSSEKRYEGTGLGLSISKACVEMMDGEIWFDSTPGKGSTFYFTIDYKPCEKHENEMRKTEKHTDKMDFLGKHILIVEDDDVNFFYYDKVLKRYNLKVSRATKGEEVFEMLRNNPDIKLILMDIQLPDMDGLDVTKYLRNKDIKLPIIAQTAYAFSSDRAKCLDAGCDNYIAKPITKEDLIELIGQYLNQ
ncbi:MAG: PAS domain S-box protein [Bacteroidales bacterium]